MAPRAWRALYGAALHPLFRFAYFSSLNIEPDELHIMHLGVSMYLLGSALWMLCYRVLPMNLVASMDRVWSMVVHYYTSMGITCQFSSLSLSSFTNPQKPRGHYPKLKGKGAEVKGLVGPLCQIWHTCMEGGREDHARIGRCLQYLYNIQNTIDEYASELFFPKEVVGGFRAEIDALLSDYCALAAQADADGDLLWNLAPKWHWFWHLGHRAQYAHPRRGACLIDEDFVGKIKVVAQAALAGTQLHNVVLKVMEKYIWGRSLTRPSPAP